MKDIKNYFIDEERGYNQTFHNEEMTEYANKLKSAGYSDNIVKLFKGYLPEYVTPQFIAQVLLELKK